MEFHSLLSCQCFDCELCFRTLFVKLRFTEILNTTEFIQSSSYRTGHVPDYQIFRIIKQYLYWLQFLKVIFFVTSLTFGLHNWRGEYSVWICPSAAASGTSGSLSESSGISLFCSKEDEIPEVYSSRSWRNPRQRIGRYHSGRCRNTLTDVSERT